MNYEVITCPQLSDWSPLVNWDNMHSLHYSHVAQEDCHRCTARSIYAVVEEVLRFFLLK